MSGPNPQMENSPEYIDSAIAAGYDVEVDIWYTDGFYLGHDQPQYKVDLAWMLQRKTKIWFHCKNVDAVYKMRKHELHYFWHENDLMTLTSQGHMWVYPGKQPIKRSIAVMPEIHDEDVSRCFGVCTDYVTRYKIV